MKYPMIEIGGLAERLERDLDEVLVDFIPFH